MLQLTRVSRLPKLIIVFEILVLSFRVIRDRRDQEIPMFLLLPTILLVLPRNINGTDNTTATNCNAVPTILKITEKVTRFLNVHQNELETTIITVFTFVWLPR